MKHYYLIILAFLFLTSSCTPLRIVRLEPADAETNNYLYGNAVTTAKVGEAVVSTSFYDSDDEVVIFHVEVENKGERAITYDPALATLTGPFGSVSSAIDPEVELLTLDLGRIKNIRNNRVWAAIGVAATTAAVVASTVDGGGSGVASDVFPSSTRQQLYTNLAFTVLDASLVAAISGRLPVEPADLPAADERSFWLEYAMRITTIKPGEVAIGKLVFPREAVEGDFTLSTAVEERTAQFLFRQTVYR